MKVWTPVNVASSVILTVYLAPGSAVPAGTGNVQAPGQRLAAFGSGAQVRDLGL